MPFFGSLGTIGRFLVVSAVVIYLFSEISTLIGSGGAGFFDGSVKFNSILGLAVNSSGNVYVGNYGDNNIRIVTPAGVVTTFAGSLSSSTGNTDGTGTNALFSGPRGVAVDSSGNLYVADFFNNRIRKITSAGVVTTLAGQTSSGSANGTGTNASFWNPRQVAVDSAGNVYVADTSNRRIRKISSEGVVTTLAGSSQGSADGTGTNAQFNFPEGIAVDSAGNVYVVDSGTNQIRRITPAGVVTTFAGSTTGFVNGVGTNAQFNGIIGIAIDSAGTIYVSDSGNYRIRTIQTSTAIVSTLAGNGTETIADGIGTNASFNNPFAVAVDSAGNVYVGDSNRIRKITSTGVVTTFAGSGVSGFTDSVQATVQFNGPDGVAVDSTGNVFVADSQSHRIRRITPAGVVTTIAGSGTNTFADGTGINASFNIPCGVTFDSSGTIYIADSGNNRIRKITPEGVVTTLAGSATYSYADGTGTNASFRYPLGIGLDSSGNVYVAEGYNNRIRKISPTGVVTTLAGSGTGEGAGTGAFADGTGTNASFSFPYGVAVDSSGNVYVADKSNHRIRRITPVGVVTTFAGSTFGSTDGTGTNATFSSPNGVAIDSSGDLYITEALGHRIRKITSAGVVTTLAGQATAGFNNATGTNARFFGPSGIAVDSAGVVYVGDQNNNRIRRITSVGVVTTLAGQATAGYSDGGWFNQPVGVATDLSGTIYVADQNNHRIRKITSVGVVSTLAGSGTAGATNATGASASFNFPRGTALDSAGNVYVADSTSRQIRRITSAGVVTTFAGSTTSGFADATGTNATFNTPVGITVDTVGTVYVSDIGNHNIRRITSAGVVTTLAGSRTATFADGVGTGASFNTPSGIVADIYGNVYVADTNNHDIRRISSDGTVTTLAGSTAGYADGTGTNAQFNFPYHISIDALGTLYVADQTNNRIRTIQTSTGVVSTLAGDGTAGFTPSRFNTPQGITIDRFRNAYVGDTGNHSIRKIPAVYTLPDNNGVVTTVAGTGGGGSFVAGTGIGAIISGITGMVFDSEGNIYMSAQSDNRILRMTPQGVITSLTTVNNASGIANYLDTNFYASNFLGNTIFRFTKAGGATSFVGSTSGFADGTGTNASFRYPRGLAVDSQGTIYVADAYNHRIRKITPAGVVTSFVGSGSGSGTSVGTFADGQTTSAGFNGPYGVAVDPAGIVYVADIGNHRIRKITPAGVVTTLAGNGTAGSTDGTGTNATLTFPADLALDLMGNIYVSEQGNCIRKITPAGVVTKLAGGVLTGYLDGVGTNAQLQLPWGITVDPSGIVYFADTGNYRIRKIGTGAVQLPLNRGVTTTFAGNGGTTFTNGTGTNATFNGPYGVAVNSVGIMYVADAFNNRIRAITTAGVVTTLAGSGSGAFADGSGASASFNNPTGVVLDSGGTLYIADAGNHRIRKITSAGVVTTLAGGGSPATGYVDGTGTSARFNGPYGVAVDSAGTVYVGDATNRRIRKITAAGVVTTLAGSGAQGSTDGTGTNATFNFPWGIAVDSAGNLYISDQQNNNIRRITPAGVVTTLAGSGTATFADGTGTNASFRFPTVITIDSTDTLYLSDSGNNRIRRITPAGVVTTVAGSGIGQFADGTGTNASIWNPIGITVDSAGILYVGDTGNQRIRKIQ